MVNVLRDFLLFHLLLCLFFNLPLIVWIIIWLVSHMRGTLREISEVYTRLWRSYHSFIKVSCLYNNSMVTLLLYQLFIQLFYSSLELSGLQSLFNEEFLDEFGFLSWKSELFLVLEPLSQSRFLYSLLYQRYVLWLKVLKRNSNLPCDSIDSKPLYYSLYARLY